MAYRYQTGLAQMTSLVLRAGSGVQVGAGDVIAMARCAQLLALSLASRPAPDGQLGRLRAICRRVLTSDGSPGAGSPWGARSPWASPCPCRAG